MKLWKTNADYQKKTEFVKVELIDLFDLFFDKPNNQRYI